MTWERLNLDAADRYERELFPKVPRRARFLVDECLGPGVAPLLRQLRWNAKDAWELELCGRADSDVYSRARKENRILLTHNDDFLDDRQFSPKDHPGVIVLPGASGGEERLLRTLGVALNVVGTYADLWRGTKLTVSSDGELKVKGYDFGTSSRKVRRFRWIGNEIYEWMESRAA